MHILSCIIINVVSYLQAYDRWYQHILIIYAPFPWCNFAFYFINRCQCVTTCTYSHIYIHIILNINIWWVNEWVSVRHTHTYTDYIESVMLYAILYSFVTVAVLFLNFVELSCRVAILRALLNKCVNALKWFELMYIIYFFLSLHFHEHTNECN